MVNKNIALIWNSWEGGITYKKHFRLESIMWLLKYKALWRFLKTFKALSDPLIHNIDIQTNKNKEFQRF